MHAGATSATANPSSSASSSLRAAAGWYRQAAAQGLAPAQYNYAVVLLARGKRRSAANGAAANEGASTAAPAQAHAHATKWFRKAAAQGHAAAQRRLRASRADIPTLRSEPAGE